MNDAKLLVVMVMLAAGWLSSCAAASGTDGGSSGSTTQSDSGAATSSRGITAISPGGPVASTTSSRVVRPQPAAGSCHARGSNGFIEPDPRCTPGAVNPDVTQQTINQTICLPGWARSVRPPERVTEPEKLASMRAYGDTGPPSEFEFDHLVSLELGGAANDPRNLWPEPGASPNPKDKVENRLHRLVCDGQLSLARAQRIIATDWVGWAQRNGIG